MKLHEDVVLNASRPVQQTNVGSTSQWRRETRVREGGVQGWGKKTFFFWLKRREFRSGCRHFQNYAFFPLLKFFALYN